MNRFIRHIRFVNGTLSQFWPKSSLLNVNYKMGIFLRTNCCNCNLLLATNDQIEI